MSSTKLSKKRSNKRGSRVDRLDNKVFRYVLTCPVPYGNVGVYSATYASVLQPFAGTGVPTILNGISGAAAGTEASFAMYFTLNDLPQVTQYQAIYDQYRIDRITVMLTYQGETGDGVYSTTVQANQQSDKVLWYLVDLDDAAPISRANIQSFENAVMHMIPWAPTRPVTVSFKPHVAVAAYQGTFAGYANQENQWLDTANANIQHYGFKCCFSSPLSASEASVRWGVYAKYHISFRNVK